MYFLFHKKTKHVDQLIDECRGSFSSNNHETAQQQDQLCAFTPCFCIMILLSTPILVSLLLVSMLS